MSDKCGNCDCADSSQCTKKGSGYAADFVETEKSHVETVLVDAPAAEHGGECPCKCGGSCHCIVCPCPPPCPH